MMELEFSFLQFQFYISTGIVATDIQILSQSIDGTEESASNNLLLQIQQATLTSEALISVEATLTSAIEGTTISGDLTLTGAEYIVLLEQFFLMLDLNLMDSSLLTLSYSLTSIEITLTAEEISQLTIIQSSLTIYTLRIETMITELNAQFTEI